MGDLSLMVPMLIAVCGVLILVSYVLCVAVRQMASQLGKMNEMLLLALGGSGNSMATRALMARAMQPAGGLVEAKKPSAEPKKKEQPSGMVMKVGSL
jgi:hypothetical protein